MIRKLGKAGKLSPVGFTHVNHLVHLGYFKQHEELFGSLLRDPIVEMLECIGALPAFDQARINAESEFLCRRSRAFSMASVRAPGKRVLAATPAKPVERRRRSSAAS